MEIEEKYRLKAEALQKQFDQEDEDEVLNLQFNREEDENEAGD